MIPYCTGFVKHLDFSFVLGLSLTALSPAAAWYFIVIVCLFLPCEAKKDTQGIENDRQAKVVCMLFFIPLGEKGSMSS
jgi:hypothetical protein